ncbi:MAG: type II toxin-antitoxin system HicA family toxin [Candidatus Margulisiibacteriota bacterium]
MSNKIPVLKGKEVVRALEKAGFVVKRTTGSHVILKNNSTSKIAIVPTHGSKDIKRGTMFSIIRQTGLSIEAFIELI